MMESITYELQSGKPDEFVLDKEYVAFSGDSCYSIYKSKNRYKNGVLVDYVRAIFNEDGELIEACPPFMGFEGGFELVRTSLLEYYGCKYMIYKEKTNEKSI